MYFSFEKPSLYYPGANYHKFALKNHVIFTGTFFSRLEIERSKFFDIKVHFLEICR